MPVKPITPPAKGERRGGRQKGTPNKRTSIVTQKAAAAGLLPHEWLAAVMRGDELTGETSIEERIRCGIEAAPFFSAKKREISGPGGGPVAVVDYSKMSAAQLEALEPVLAALLKGGG